MLYEKLTLDQFESALKKSNFSATKDEVNEIRHRVFMRLIFNTVHLSVEDALSNSEIESTNHLKPRLTADGVRRSARDEQHENGTYISIKNDHFRDYLIDHIEINQESKFDEAA